MQGSPAGVTTTLSSFRWQEDVTDSGGKPPCVRGLVWLAKPVPYGRAMIVYIPACAAPWKGAQPGAEERAKTKELNQAQKRESQDRGTQPGAEERAKTKELNQAQKRESQDRGAQPGAEGSKTITYKFFCAQPPLPFQGRGRGRGVKNHGEPEGRKPESHTKTLA